MGKKEKKEFSLIIFNRKIGKKAFSLILAGMITLAFFLGVFTNYAINRSRVGSLDWVVELINKHYCVYDEKEKKLKEFSQEDLIRIWADKLLDEYSTYYTAQEYSDVYSTMQGNRYGTGIGFSTKSDTNVIKAITGNSPAEKAGIKKGDTFLGVEIDGVKTLTSTKNEALKALREAPIEKTIKVYILRDSEELTFEVKKEIFIASYVVYYDSETTLKFVGENGEDVKKKVINQTEMKDFRDDTAYILLSQFEGGADTQFATAMEYVKERNKKFLILDLRGNGGGTMDILLNIASYLIYEDGNPNPIVAYAKDKNGRYERFTANGDNFNRELEQIYVIADEDTASASECLIGAMRCHTKSFVLKDNFIIAYEGNSYTHTYGKGIMQTTYRNYFTGEALKLTTAYMFQPDRTTCIHGRGIFAFPDNTVRQNEAIDHAMNLIEAYKAK